MNDGFMSHRKSNEIDLKIKYDYLYTLASKVSSEAKLIMVKRKVDPDRTMLSYLQEPVRTDNDYVLDSDYSSGEENFDKKLGELNLSDSSDLDDLDLENDIENRELSRNNFDPSPPHSPNCNMINKYEYL